MQLRWLCLHDAGVGPQFMEMVMNYLAELCKAVIFWSKCYWTNRVFGLLLTYGFLTGHTLKPKLSDI